MKQDSGWRTSKKESAACEPPPSAPSVLACCRSRKGNVIKAAPFQTPVLSGEVARVEPNRKWFGKLALRLVWSEWNIWPAG